MPSGSSSTCTWPTAAAPAANSGAGATSRNCPPGEASMITGRIALPFRRIARARASSPAGSARSGSASRMSKATPLTPASVSRSSKRRVDRAPPRPAADLVEALLVDGHDDDVVRRGTVAQHECRVIERLVEAPEPAEARRQGRQQRDGDRGADPFDEDRAQQRGLAAMRGSLTRVGRATRSPRAPCPPPRWCAASVLRGS